MKAVILAGGLGSRISEETILKPKPMIEIGGMPILWHIMKIYSFYGINDFIICCGYKGYLIKEYFANYFLHMSDVTLDTSDNSMIVHKKNSEKWKITLVDTGESTQTGGRLKRVSKFLQKEDNFCFTYGDGLSDIDIKKSINFHKKKKRLVTVSAVKAAGKYGEMVCKSGSVSSFIEKPLGNNSYVNGGFFILSKSVLNYIKNDDISWEEHVLKKLVKKKQVNAFIHKGFWHAMDTLRDKNFLENLWKNKKAKWKIWI